MGAPVACCSRSERPTTRASGHPASASKRATLVSRHPYRCMSIFELIAVLLSAAAVLGYLNHRVVRLPDTVGITFLGLLLSLTLTILGRFVPGAVGWASSFGERLDMTEIVFHGLLGILLFAGSLHINISDLARQRIPVLVLSTVGVLLSIGIIGLGSHWLLHLIGLPIELKYCFLFGALISPTDPIAVLGVLKTAGAPRSLETAIAGESLFNDGTGVVAYLVLLAIVTGSGEPTVSTVTLLLATQVAGALAVGLVLGYAGYFMIKGVDSYPVEILVTLALATGGYALAERLGVSVEEVTDRLASALAGIAAVLDEIGPVAMARRRRQR